MIIHFVSRPSSYKVLLLLEKIPPPSRRIADYRRRRDFILAADGIRARVGLAGTAGVSRVFLVIDHQHLLALFLIIEVKPRLLLGELVRAEIIDKALQFRIFAFHAANLFFQILDLAVDAVLLGDIFSQRVADRAQNN